MAAISMLPPECSLHPESEDEESFVVLGHSLPPESIAEVKNDVSQLIDSSLVQQSISLTTTALELNNLSSPSLPKLDEDLCVTRQYASVGNSTPNLSVDLSPDEIQQKVDVLIAENLKLKETLHQNNLAMKKQYAILSTWQDEVAMVHNSHKDKFSDIKKYVEKVRLENAQFSTIIATKSKKCEELMNEIEHLKSEQALAAAKDKVDIKVLKSSFDNLSEFELLSAKKKIKELEQQLVTERDNLKEVQSSAIKVEALTDDLEKLKLNNDTAVNNLNKKLRESEALQKILLDEIKSLKAQLLTASTAKESQVNFEEQLMAAQMHITQLELIRNEDRETINSNEEKILQLENQIKETVTSNDTITLLHAQLEQYKADFHAEQEAKVRVGVEKEKIADDLRNLQRRNQQLLEEVERLRGSDYVYVAKEEENPVPPESPEPVVYTCPMCLIHFRSLRVLEDHVEYCVFHTQ